MKNLKALALFAIFSGALMFTSCEEEPTCNVICDTNYERTEDCTCERILADNEILITDNVSSNTTWTSDKIHILANRISVVDGATLTIEPGTIIKGEEGIEANATALLVSRGSKIQANGTANAPIIFTSDADMIQPGDIESPNLAVTSSGLWGGVIILGNAPISADASAVQIEGIPPSDQNGLYGGSDISDNSGSFTYVSIRHGGADIGEGNEINGLTLGGVGNGTTINHVEIISNVDDGFEFFGGSVNASDLLVWNQGDDAYDCDQSWSGMVDNFIYIAGANSDHALELDGAEGTDVASFTFRNGSLKGFTAGEGEYIDFRDEVRCDIRNSYFFNFPGVADVELDSDGESALWTSGDITVTDLEFNVSHLTEGNLTITDIFADKSETLDAFADRAPDAQIVDTRSLGANRNDFMGWSLAAVTGELSDF